MLDLLNAKKQELEEKLILLDEAIEKTEAKLELVKELIKEEESKAQTFAEASCEANPVAAEATFLELLSTAQRPPIII